MDNVLFAVFEFIETLACSEHKKLQKLVATVMNDLVHLLMSHMQSTEQQVMGSRDAYVDNPVVVNYRILELVKDSVMYCAVLYLMIGTSAYSSLSHCGYNVGGDMAE